MLCVSTSSSVFLLSALQSLFLNDAALIQATSRLDSAQPNNLVSFAFVSLISGSFGLPDGYCLPRNTPLFFLHHYIPLDFLSSLNILSPIPSAGSITLHLDIKC